LRLMRISSGCRWLTCVICAATFSFGVKFLASSGFATSTLKMFEDRRARKWQRCAAAIFNFNRRANSRVAPFSELCFNFFLTIKQALNCARAWFRLPRIERLFNAAQNNVQRHLHFLPTLNQRPIHWAQQQMLGAASDKSIFDFSKVVEVVQKSTMSNDKTLVAVSGL